MAEALPDFLNLSDEQIAANKRQQDVLRKKFNTRLKMTAEEQERASAIVLEESLRESLAEARTTTESRKFINRQLAEALASQGRFGEAAATTDLVREAKIYGRISEAVWKDDEDLCDCEPETQAVNGVKIELPKYRVLKQIYSIKEAKIVNLLECNCCKKWNARPLTDDLIKISRQADLIGRTKRKKLMIWNY